MMIITSSSMSTNEWMSEMVCRNFRFHTPLPKASIQQLMNEEKGEIINEI